MSARQIPHADDSGMRSSADDADLWLVQHGDALYQYARSRVGNREVAEDLVQDALLAALQSRDQFQSRATIRTWLVSILRHKIVDFYRREMLSEPVEKADSTGKPDVVIRRYFGSNGLWKKSVASWKTPDRALEEREFWIVLDRCMSRLPRPLAAVFILRELEEIDAGELCRMLALSAVNLRVRLHRARILLRECLETHWFAESPSGSRRTP